MSKSIIIAAFYSTLALFFSAPITAETINGNPAANSAASGFNERIYGSHLMTRAERADYRGNIRSAKSEDERKKIRIAHHKLMDARAMERGITLTDDAAIVNSSSNYYQ